MDILDLLLILHPIFDLMANEKFHFAVVVMGGIWGMVIHFFLDMFAVWWTKPLGPPLDLDHGISL